MVNGMYEATIAGAKKLLDGCNEVILASITEEGYPRACVLSKTKAEGLKKIYVSTGSNSVKVRQFLKNPKAGLCFYGNGNSVTLTGTLVVRQDAQIKREMWLDWFIDHYQGGSDDPNYCILEFTTQSATLWVDGEFVTLEAAAL